VSQMRGYVSAGIETHLVQTHDESTHFSSF
jgi:hypothetical protein